MNRILLLSFVFIFQITSSQEFNLNKGLIMNKAFDSSDKKFKRSEESYWDVVFKANGFATFIIDKNLRTEAPFKVNGYKINLANVSYNISKITPGSLADERKVITTF